jgi:hypothetical protein
VQFSIVGALVCAGIFLFGVWLRAPFIGGLLASLPFGSTAIVTLGGSSPQVFTVFELALLASVALRKGFLEELAAVLVSSRAAPTVVALIVYAAATAVLLPRLFSGETSVHIVVEGFVVEYPLAPSPGNITQSAYLFLGGLTFLAFCILLQRANRWAAVERAFFAFVTIHAALGVIDLSAKMAGAGDVLEFLRTANYALLVEVLEQGFWRIVGAYPEASTFAGYSMPCLAFAFIYWKNTGSTYALTLSVVLFTLVTLSTSTTAYASLAVVILLLSVSTLISAFKAGLTSRDLQFFGLAWIGITIALGAYLYNEDLFDPFVAMLDTMVFNKASSVSGVERAYWNAKSMEAFFDTYGMGVGMGSSRASSWLVAVLSQLGFVGTLMFAFLVAALVRRTGPVDIRGSDREIVAFAESIRAATIAWLVPAAISSGSADPGLIFFIGLAVVVSCRQRFSQVVRPLAPYQRATPAIRGGRLE